VVEGSVEVLNDQHTLAELAKGQAFGEMAMLSGGTRTASVRAKTDTELLALGKDEFDKLLAEDPFLDEQVRTLSQQRASSNLNVGGANPTV